MTTDIPALIQKIRNDRGWSRQRLGKALASSPASVTRWEEGSAEPSPSQSQAIVALSSTSATSSYEPVPQFASHGARSTKRNRADIATDDPEVIPLLKDPGTPIMDRITAGDQLRSTRSTTIDELIARHLEPASTVKEPPATGMSAGKNTYTYDAHTYHTKVPPQGIAELVRHYLPAGGLVLDPFAGSGMTGVAAAVLGDDCILNELSPAACFIESQFSSSVPPSEFAAAIRTVLQELSSLRTSLYSTTCRECGDTTELLYTVWSYRVICPHCECNFNLWDACRRYGRTVREHKILSEFPCPKCQTELKKSKLQRLEAEPVQVGYRCCGSKRIEVTHPPSLEDVERIRSIEDNPPLALGWYPTTPLWDGVNLGQPKRHGLTSVDRFYTGRNLAAMSNLWKVIHCIPQDNLAAQVAFVFTSLYRRVTKFSEFRFWGGSGNSARLNVPFIYDEPNVFVSFERKAKTIADHLESTAVNYSGNVVIRNGSATDLADLPDSSVDLVFTDPPFGSNINYSEMNLLWESWLNRFTDSTEEAIVNKVQGKSLEDYENLMAKSLKEAFRVLRPDHWMLMVFMNSSAKVWSALERSIGSAGFVLVKADIFDKQHGTFKHFVSPNTAGADLVLHCIKPSQPEDRSTHAPNIDVQDFLNGIDLERYLQSYLHVARPSEFDLRRLYSEWIAATIVTGGPLVDFAHFRDLANQWIKSDSARSDH